MKLYHNGREWQLPGLQDKDAQRIDTPKDPVNFAHWLNERNVQPEPAAPPPPQREAAVAAVAPNMVPDEIAEWILDFASQAEVEALFAAIGTRWGELRRLA